MIARIFACFLLLLVATRGAVDAADALPLAEDRVLRTWKIADGLGDNHISGVARDADGYLWVTNFSGLFRFDGVRFVHMDAERLPGLPTPWVAPVFVSDAGALWLGLERGGAARWSNGKLDTPAPVRPRPTDEVWPWSFAEDAAGAVWMGAAHTARVTRFAGGERREFGPAEGLPGGRHTVVRVAADGSPWVATSEGCAVWDGGGRFRAVDPAAGGGGGGRPALAVAREGGVWALRGGRLLRYGPGGERRQSLAPEWLSRVGQVNALHEDAEGALWIGTRDVGLLRLRDGVFERVPTSFADVSWLSEDRDGNLRVGTWGGGLDRVSARRFFLRAAEAGRPGRALYSVCEDTEGRLWAVGRRGEPLRSVATGTGRGADGDADGVGEGGREGDAAFAPVPDWPTGKRATVVCADPSGGVWLGTSEGVLRRRGGRVDTFELGEPAAALLVGGDGALWIGTEAGSLWRLHEDRPAPMEGPRAVRALAEDGRGRLWVGDQAGGVFVREPEAARDGGRGGFVPVALPGAGAEETVRFLVPDGADTVWIGTLLGGLYRWREGRVARVPEPANRLLAEVRSLLIEPRSGGPRAARNAADVFWLGTATGLWRTTRGELDDYIDGRRTSSPLTLCGANEGLPTLEFAVRGQNASVRTRGGRLCFATNRGWLEIPPGTAVEPAGETRVLIEEASVNPGNGSTGEEGAGGADEKAEANAGRRRYFFTGGVSGAVEFPPRPEAVSIRYTLPELGVPEGVRFRYRIGGGGGGGAGAEETSGADADAGWIEAGAQRETTIVRPEPGNYRFEVAARVGDGPWSRAAAVLDFSVRAAWWQTVWFRGGVVLMLAAGLGAVVRAWATRRMRAKIRRLEQERMIERERARIARDMHDELGADLTLITSMARAAEAEPATDPRQMGDLSELARRTVESLDAIVWAVNPRNDSLAGTVEFIGKFAAGFLAKAGIETELVWPESGGIPSRPVSAEPRHHLFLAIKESLANIVKHSGARRVRMEMRVEAARLTVVVEDDGRGFAPGAGDRFSDGFANMRGRMAEVGGDCRAEGRAGAGAGCRVVFELPLRDAPAPAPGADSTSGDSA